MLGLIIGLVIIGYELISSKPEDMATIQAFSTGNIGYIQTGTTLLASDLYYRPEGFKIGEFQAYLLGGWYQFINGKHHGYMNLMMYENYPLPQHISTIQNTSYGGDTNEQKVAKYIQNFIVLEPEAINENMLKKPVSTLPQVDLIDQFKLGCLDSAFLLVDDFCQYNLEQFAKHSYQYDIIYDFTIFVSLFQHIQTLSGSITHEVCESVVNYEMLSGKPDNKLDALVEKCNEKVQKTHQSLLKRKQFEKEITTTLLPTIDQDTLRNQFKLVSSMQLLQTQIMDNKIDITFLNSYYDYVKLMLASSQLDQFTIDVIYKFHNQFLLKGLLDLQNVVNLDTVTDLQNSMEKIDRLNVGDSANGVVGLKGRISSGLVLPTDYTEEHPSLGAEELNTDSNNQSEVDTSIINDLIGAVDSTIEDTLNSGGSDTIINTTPVETSNQNPNTDGQEDLNSYQPQKSTSYNPSNLDTQEKTLVSDRMFNNLGIKPDLVLVKGDKYFVERSYQGFVFSAILDKNNNRRLNPIYVKIDEVRTLVPGFMLDLMDYDRYAQVKFLKNPEQYVRQATQ